MARRAFIVHRWGGNPNADWYQWLKGMLVDRGFEVFVPQMPNPASPHISAWVPYLAKTVGKADNDTYFIGHSIGCQTIIRYLETLDGDAKVGGAAFVAGWFHLIDDSITSDEEKEIAAEWSMDSIDFVKVRRHLDKSFACFSDNDPFVPLSDAKIFEEKLGSKIIIHPKRGHFTSEDGVSELHVALNEILKMSKD